MKQKKNTYNRRVEIEPLMKFRKPKIVSRAFPYHVYPSRHCRAHAAQFILQNYYFVCVMALFIFATPAET